MIRKEDMFAYYAMDQGDTDMLLVMHKDMVRQEMNGDQLHNEYVLLEGEGDAGDVLYLCRRNGKDTGTYRMDPEFAFDGIYLPMIDTMADGYIFIPSKMHSICYYYMHVGGVHYYRRCPKAAAWPAICSYLPDFHLGMNAPELVEAYGTEKLLYCTMNGQIVAVEDSMLSITIERDIENILQEEELNDEGKDVPARVRYEVHNLPPSRLRPLHMHMVVARTEVASYLIVYDVGHSQDMLLDNQVLQLWDDQVADLVKWEIELAQDKGSMANVELLSLEEDDDEDQE